MVGSESDMNGIRGGMLDLISETTECSMYLAFLPNVQQVTPSLSNG